MAIALPQIAGCIRILKPAIPCPLRLGLLGLAALLFTACRPTPHSNPATLRNTSDYLKATSPVPPRALDPAVLNQLTVSHEGETLVVTLPSRAGANDSDDGFAHSVTRLAPGQKLEGTGARLELVAFAVSGPGLSKTTNEQNAPLDFFAQDGKQLTAGELKALGFKPWQLRDSLTGSSIGIDDAFPKLRVELGSRSQPPGGYSLLGLFDARTKKSLVTGSSYTAITGEYFGEVNTRPHLWHGAPLELVLDVELDGKSVVQTALAPGKRVSVPGGQVQFLGVWDGKAASWSTQSGNPMVLRMSLQQSQGEPSATAVFATEPPKLAVHVELLNAQGRPLANNGGGSCDAIRFTSLRAHSDDVKQARLTVFTNHYYAVLPLPAPPSLPAENQHLENLFAVTIPQVQVRSESELRDLIGDITQFHFAYPAAGDVLSTNLFPLLLTNTSPAQLLETYRGHLPKGWRVVVDEPRNEIRLDLLPFQKVKQWVVQHLP